MEESNFANHPFLLGFERLDTLMARSGKNEGYPPYNIEQTGEHRFRITLAVAGFAEEDLSIILDNGELKIKGTQSENPQETVYLHRGIATRQFQRGFALAEGVEVDHAYMEKGLLHIELRRKLPPSRSHKIKINRR